VTDVIGESSVEGLALRNVIDNTERTLPVTGFFLAIGHTPNTKPFAGKLRLDDSGYVIPAPGGTTTSVPGVFACGDVQDIVYRQAITAAGSGCAAALDCERWLENESHH
jgi:thioredoxin reductase (NADPH)